MIGRGALLSIGSAALVAALNYALNVLLGWSLSVAEYGRLGVSQTLIFVYVWFLGAGFPWVVTRAIAQARGGFANFKMADALRIYKTAGLANAVLTLLLSGTLLLAQLHGWLPLEPAYTPLIWMVAITVAALGLGAVPNAGLQGLFRFGRIAGLRVAEAGVNLGLSVALVVLGLGATGALAGFAAAAVLATGLSIWLVRDLPFWRVKGWGNLSSVRAAVPLTLAVFGGVLLTNVDLLAVKSLSAPMSSDALSGTYQVAAVLARAPLFIGTALVSVYYPRIAQRAAVRAHGLQAARELLRWLALTVLPINAVMIVGGTAVVLFFFPDRYVAAGLTLSVLAIGSALLTWASGLAASYQALGRTRGPAIVMAGAVVCQLVGLAYLVPRFGTLGAAVASTLASLLACALLVGFNHGIAVLPTAPRRHALAIGTMLVAALPLGLLATQSDRFALAAWGSFAVLCYVIACGLLRVVRADELRGFVPAGGPKLAAALILAGVSFTTRLNELGRSIERAAGSPEDASW